MNHQSCTHSTSQRAIAACENAHQGAEMAAAYDEKRRQNARAAYFEMEEQKAQATADRKIADHISRWHGLQSSTAFTPIGSILVDGERIATSDAAEIFEIPLAG